MSRKPSHRWQRGCRKVDFGDGGRRALRVGRGPGAGETFARLSEPVFVLRQSGQIEFYSCTDSAAFVEVLVLPCLFQKGSRRSRSEQGGAQDRREVANKHVQLRPAFCRENGEVDLGKDDAVP